jgi:sugar diacid utilization regulator
MSHEPSSRPVGLPAAGQEGAGAPRAQELGDWLSAVALAAAADARAPVELLGEYLPVLADAALTGRQPEAPELSAVRRLGGLAAERGVDANQVVDLYLAVASRLWQGLPQILSRPREPEQIAAAAGAVLQVLNDAVAALVEGHQEARRALIRQEESARREFLDDLLRGDADVSRLVERAEPFGLDLTREHLVVLAAPASAPGALERAAVVMERFVVDRIGDREVLVASKDDLLVMIVPGALRDAVTGAGIADAAAFLQPELARRAAGTAWQVAAGRPFPGAYGIARSYEEAREALLLARRLRLTEHTIPTRDLLAFRVLGRDQAALIDLIHGMLAPLTAARGGAEPLLHTLSTYFATGAVATETARRLHLSVRTVTYRLSRIALLTGHDPGDPANHLALQMAVLGARLLDWPATELPRQPLP